MGICGIKIAPCGMRLLLAGILLPSAPACHETQTRTGQGAPAVAWATPRTLSFEENRGQFSDPAQFLAQAPGFTLSLEPQRATMKLHAGDAGRPPVTLGMTIVGGNETRLTGYAPAPGVTHYLRSSAAKDAVRDVRRYEGVRYENVYPGIDLVFRSDADKIEYDFIVSPGAVPDRIRMAFTGIEGAALDANGDLVLQTTHGAVRHQRPRLYQDIDGTRREVAGSFILSGQDSAGFQVGPYDTRHTLVIDPVLVYSTLHGGCRGHQGIQDVAVDAAGSAYVVGYYPWDCDRGPSNVFVSKFSSSGALVFRTNFGGWFGDEAGGIAVDRAGNIYVTGSTDESLPGPPPFPTTENAFQPAHGGAVDAFVTKLDPAGAAILYSTFLGGAGPDSGSDIEVDAQGRIVVAGNTGSTNFPTVNPWQPQLSGATDTFVAVFDPAGSGLVFSTYIGGSLDDTVARLAISANGITLTGTTESADFPVRTALQPGFGGGGSDAFLSRLSWTGTLLTSTYFGGSADDQGFGLAIDNAGAVYLAGSTASPDLPTVNPLQPQLSFPPEADAFLAKITPDTASMAYATYLEIGADARCAGLLPADPCGGVAVDNSGNAYVTAGSPLSQGAFVVKVDAAGANRLYTFNGFGGHGIAVRPGGRTPGPFMAPRIVVAGRTRAMLFPVVHAFDSYRNSYETEEGWLMKFIDSPNPAASFEENDPRIAYTGAWEAHADPQHSGGSALRSREVGAAAAITFTGTGLQVLSRRDPSAGVVMVRRGLEPPIALDAYASPAEPRALLLSISNLPKGTYTVTLEVTDARNQRSNGTSIWIDGIHVLGSD